mmetsp:Transcript_118816/g.314145  ORF Transcript_118816/g.314145 Transcript_118816/m.314145 type:complete len:250 (-) Transcript_118816:2-751(-)
MRTETVSVPGSGFVQTWMLFASFCDVQPSSSRRASMSLLMSCMSSTSALYAVVLCTLARSSSSLSASSRRTSSCTSRSAAKSLSSCSLILLAASRTAFASAGSSQSTSSSASSSSVFEENSDTIGCVVGEGSVGISSTKRGDMLPARPARESPRPAIRSKPARLPSAGEVGAAIGLWPPLSELPSAFNSEAESPPGGPPGSGSALPFGAASIGSASPSGSLGAQAQNIGRAPRARGLGKGRWGGPLLEP